MFSPGSKFNKILRFGLVQDYWAIPFWWDLNFVNYFDPKDDILFEIVDTLLT